MGGFESFELLRRLRVVRSGPRRSSRRQPANSARCVAKENLRYVVVFFLPVWPFPLEIPRRRRKRVDFCTCQARNPSFRTSGRKKKETSGKRPTPLKEKPRENVPPNLGTSHSKEFVAENLAVSTKAETTRISKRTGFPLGGGATANEVKGTPKSHSTNSLHAPSGRPRLPPACRSRRKTPSSSCSAGRLPEMSP